MRAVRSHLDTQKCRRGKGHRRSSWVWGAARQRHKVCSRSSRSIGRSYNTTLAEQTCFRDRQHRTIAKRCVFATVWEDLSLEFATRKQGRWGRCAFRGTFKRLHVPALHVRSPLQAPHEMALAVSPLFHGIWRSLQDTSERQASEFAAIARRASAGGEAEEHAQPPEEHLRTWVLQSTHTSSLFVEPHYRSCASIAALL